MNARNLLKKKSVRIKIILLLLVGALTSGACIRLYIQDYANRTLVRYHDDSFSLKVIRKNMHYYAIRKSFNQIDTTNLGFDCYKTNILWTNENYVCLDLDYDYKGGNSYTILPKDVNQTATKYTGVIAISEIHNLLVQVDSIYTVENVSKLKIFNWTNNKSQLIPLNQSFDKYTFCSFGQFGVAGNKLTVQFQNYNETFVIDPELLVK